MIMATMPTPFGREVTKLVRGRRVEDLGLSEESETILREHLQGENTTLPSAVVQEIADSLGVDWRNGGDAARELSNAACWYLFVGGYDQRTHQLQEEQE